MLAGNHAALRDAAAGHPTVLISKYVRYVFWRGDPKSNSVAYVYSQQLLFVYIPVQK